MSSRMDNSSALPPPPPYGVDQGSYERSLHKILVRLMDTAKQKKGSGLPRARREDDRVDRVLPRIVQPYSPYSHTAIQPLVVRPSDLDRWEGLILVGFGGVGLIGVIGGGWDERDEREERDWRDWRETHLDCSPRPILKETRGDGWS